MATIFLLYLENKPENGHCAQDSSSVRSIFIFIGVFVPKVHYLPDKSYKQFLKSQILSCVLVVIKKTKKNQKNHPSVTHRKGQRGLGPAWWPRGTPAASPRLPESAFTCTQWTEGDASATGHFLCRPPPGQQAACYVGERP